MVPEVPYTVSIISSSSELTLLGRQGCQLEGKAVKTANLMQTPNLEFEDRVSGVCGHRAH